MIRYDTICINGPYWQSLRSGLAGVHAREIEIEIRDRICAAKQRGAGSPACTRVSTTAAPSIRNRAHGSVDTALAATAAGASSAHSSASSAADAR
jgi:hypothetical protein